MFAKEPCSNVETLGRVYCLSVYLKQQLQSAVVFFKWLSSNVNKNNCQSDYSLYRHRSKVLLACTWRHGGDAGGQEQKHLSPLGTKLYFHVNWSRKNSVGLTPNMAALSRGCKLRIVRHNAPCYSYLIKCCVSVKEGWRQQNLSVNIISAFEGDSSLLLLFFVWIFGILRWRRAIICSQGFKRRTT